MVLGGILVGVYGFIRRDHNFSRSRVAEHAPTFALIGILSLFFAPGQFQLMLEEFATKGEGEFGGLTEAFAESRESLIDRSMNNFRHIRSLELGLACHRILRRSFSRLREWAEFQSVLV